MESDALYVAAHDTSSLNLRDRSLHRLLLDNQCQVYIGTTGAGPRLLASIWDVPGCSPYFVGANLPYNKYQTDCFVGYRNDECYVSKALSLELAMSSYIAAEETRISLSKDGMSVGVGVEAAVSTGRVIKGGLRVHITIITPDCVYYELMELDNNRVGQGARVADDTSVSERVCALLERILSKEITNDVSVSQEAINQLFLHPVFSHDNRRLPASDLSGRVYLAANLNPIHDGHRQMCRAAESNFDIATFLGIGSNRVCYLVEIDPPNKKPLSLQDMLHTVGMIRADRWSGEARTVEFTRGEHLYIEKARRRQSSVFLMGADAMQRMMDPSWGPDITAMLTEFKQLNTRFYVMGRLVDGKWLECRDIPVVWPHSDLFRPLSGRVDESSTRIRESRNVKQ